MCTMCKAICYFYCKECSGVGGTRFTNLCGPTTGCQCISCHIQHALLGKEEAEEEEEEEEEEVVVVVVVEEEEE